MEIKNQSKTTKFTDKQYKTKKNKGIYCSINRLFAAHRHRPTLIALH
jgi:hypothetical protein